MIVWSPFVIPPLTWENPTVDFYKSTPRPVLVAPIAEGPRQPERG